MSEPLRLSLVIPVFNEEHHIKGCLQAIANQTVAPYEVILVDNNCTDSTLIIAKEFDFVTVISEPKQGRGNARTAGFNHARGEIIGRIDADSRIAPDWVERALAAFSNDTELAAITGLGNTDLLHAVGFIKTKFWSRAYFWTVHGKFRTITMWGANCALRRSSWTKVAGFVCNDDHIVHEDQDVSLCLAAEGHKIVQDNGLIVTTRGQTYRYLPKIYHYWRLERSTYKLHKNRGTFDSPKFRKLNYWQILPGRILAITASAPFFVLSLIFLPIDLIMIAIGRRQTWLD